MPNQEAHHATANPKPKQRMSQNHGQSSSSNNSQNIQNYNNTNNVQLLAFSESYRNNGHNNMNKKGILELYTCHECNSSFTSEQDLSLHSKTHKPQPYKCNECSRAYTRREKLTGNFILLLFL